MYDKRKLKIKGRLYLAGKTSSVILDPLEH